MRKRFPILFNAIFVFVLLFFAFATFKALNVNSYSPPITRVAGIQVGSGGDVSAMDLSGNYAFVSLPAGGLSVIDISNPANPQQVKQFPMSAGVMSIAISGNRAYVGTSNNSAGPEFFVFDISSPANLNISGSLELGASVSNFKAIAISGQYAYVGTESDGTGNDDPGGERNEFHIINISNSSLPTETGGINPDSFDKNGFSILSVAISGNYAFVGRSTGYDSRNCFSSIDISNPASPSIVSTLAWGGSISGYAVSIFDHYAFLGIYDAGDSYDAAIADISNPTQLRSVKAFSDLGGRIMASDASGKYVFAGGSYNYSTPPAQNFKVFDVSNPSISVELGSIPLGAHATGMAVMGNYAFVTTWANSNGNFQVIDISAFTNNDTTSPQISMSSLGGVNLSGNITISATASDDIRVADVLFKVDGNNISDPVTSPDLNSPYSVVWDTTDVSDGSHVLSAVAKDTSGNTTESSPVSVVVDNAGGDEVAPIVSVALPEDGSNLANYVLAKADATDNFAVANVQFKLDGNNLGAPVANAPYKIAWDTNTASNGVHTITAVATDTSNNHKTSNGVSITVDNSNKWFSSFSPQHEFYVSPSGTGDGSSRNSPMSLSSAVSNANPGDLIWFLGGTYVNGTLTLTRNGSFDHPIVWRALPGEHVLINGHIRVQGEHNWVWGFEVTDASKLSSDNGISLGADGARAINNVIHDLLAGGATLGASNGYSGIVAYGNINYGGAGTPFETVRGHLVYPQNTFSDHGYKYFVNNVFVDPPKQACNFQYDGNGNVTAAQDCFAFHAYATSGVISGMNIQKNIFANGRVLVGGYGVPADREIMNGNYFYKTGPQFGYTRPTQAECRNNYIGLGQIMSNWWWGEGEVQFTQRAPNIFRDNEVYNNGAQMDIRTSAYTTVGRQEGVTPFQKSDSVDNNKFSSPFRANLSANNTSTNANDINSWRSATAAANNSFDSNSQVVSFPTSPKVFVIPNEYESDRGHIAVYNWDHGANASADLSSVLEEGDNYFIYDAKDAFGSPIASGIYNGGSVNIPTGGAEFLSLIITSTANYSRADINTDLRIDLTDFNILKQDFLKITGNLTDSRSDVNADGQATIKDIGIMMSGWRP